MLASLLAPLILGQTAQVQSFPEASLSMEFGTVLQPRRDPLAEIKKDLGFQVGDRVDDLLWQGTAGGVTMNFAYVLTRTPQRQTGMDYLADIQKKLEAIPEKTHTNLVLSEIKILGRPAARLTFTRPKTNTRGVFNVLIDGNRMWNFDFFWPESRTDAFVDVERTLASVRVQTDDRTLQSIPYRLTSPINGVSVELPFSPGWRDLPDEKDPVVTQRGFWGAVVPGKISFSSWSHVFGENLASDNDALAQAQVTRLRGLADRNTLRPTTAAASITGVKGVAVRGTYSQAKVRWFFESSYLSAGSKTWLIEIAVSEDGGGAARLRQIVASLRLIPEAKSE